MNYRVEPSTRCVKNNTKPLYVIRDDCGRELFLSNQPQCDLVAQLLKKAYEAGKASHSKAIVNSWSKRNAAVRIQM